MRTKASLPDWSLHPVQLYPERTCCPAGVKCCLLPSVKLYRLWMGFIFLVSFCARSQLGCWYYRSFFSCVSWQAVGRGLKKITLGFPGMANRYYQSSVWGCSGHLSLGWLWFGCIVGGGRRCVIELRQCEGMERSSVPHYCCCSHLCNITYRNVNHLLLLNFEHLVCGMLSCFLESIC